MVHQNMFSKATVRMDVKLDEVEESVKSYKVNDDVKLDARLVVVEVDVHE